MVLPIVILVVIPIFLGISYVAPFEPPTEIEEPAIPENSGASVLYVLLMGIWVIFLLIYQYNNQIALTAKSEYHVLPILLKEYYYEVL